MKLKGLPNRAYNILFHTHTVSGIVISFGLFIIFYAGAFSLFRYELFQWENPEARFKITEQSIDFDRTIDSVKAAYPSFVIQDPFSLRLPSADKPFLAVYGSIQEESEDHTHRFSALINTKDYTVVDWKEKKTTLGDTLYHLHYFAQIPAGRYISGFVALFFLFATITGLLIHWRNLITKFYGFTAKGKWKQIWTNAHTVLGVIGLPFQVVYAITGALFGLLTLLLIPSALILFNGDTDKITAAVRPTAGIKVDKQAPINDNMSVNDLYRKVETRFGKKAIYLLNFNNYGRIDGVMNVRTDDKEGLLGDGIISYALKSGEPILEILPYKKEYAVAVLNLITKLHFGTFGGLALKIVYFVLAMLTCFMLISGILIWQAARDKAPYTAAQRLFQHRVTKIYLAICLSMFPATALIFIANKLVPWEWTNRVLYVNSIFFLGWLALIIVGVFWDKYARINKNYLVIGGILSLLIPVVNGLVTGDWIWVAWQKEVWRVAIVDVFWLMTGLIALSITTNLALKEQDKISTKVKQKKAVLLPIVEEVVANSTLTL